MNYQRFTQWAAGPVALAAGWLATVLVDHVHAFGDLTSKQGQVAGAMTDAGVFAVGALVTYLAHAKWFSNLQQWWKGNFTGAVGSNYERIVQWAAGPVAIAAGWLAAQLVQHVGIFGNAGVTVQGVAGALTTVLTFGVGALVVYAAHHNWLANLPAAWFKAQRDQVRADANRVVAASTTVATTEGGDITSVGAFVNPESRRKPDGPEAT